MDELIRNQVEALFKCAETVNEIFSVAYKIAILEKYPDSAKILDSTEELKKQIFMLQNFLVSPESKKNTIL